jgi:hypothetical protein
VEKKGKGADDDSETKSDTEPTDAPSGVPSESEEDPSEPPKKKARFSKSQVQALDKLFQEHPFPEEYEKKELSEMIGIETTQVRHWFMNRRRQEKVKRERDENAILKKEIEMLRAEIELLKEALDKITFPNCGGGSLGSSSNREDHNPCGRVQLHNRQRQGQDPGQERYPTEPAETGHFHRETA